MQNPFSVSNHRSRPTPSNRGSRGAAGWITVFVLAVVLISVVLAWWALGGTAASERPLTWVEAQDRAATLSEKFEAALVNQRDPAPLLPDIERLVERRPDLPEAHRLLGQMQNVMLQNDAAYASFEQALELSDQNAELHVLAGGVAEELERWSDAEAHYSAAQELKPQDAEVWVRLANVAIKQQRWDVARPLLFDALEREATLHEAHALMAALHTQQGDPDAALASMEQAYNLLTLQGGEALRKTALRLSEMLTERGEPVLAAKVLRVPEPEDFFTPEIMAAHAEALGQAGMALDAGQYYEQWSRREPANPLPAAEAVRWYLHSGEGLNEARAMLVVLRRIGPRHPQLLALERELQNRSASAGPAD